jgi:hypothetical protein
MKKIISLLAVVGLVGLSSARAFAGAIPIAWSPSETFIGEYGNPVVVSEFTPSDTSLTVIDSGVHYSSPLWDTNIFYQIVSGGKVVSGGGMFWGEATYTIVVPRVPITINLWGTDNENGKAESVKILDGGKVIYEGSPLTVNKNPKLGKTDFLGEQRVFQRSGAAATKESYLKISNAAIAYLNDVTRQNYDANMISQALDSLSSDFLKTPEYKNLLNSLYVIIPKIPANAEILGRIKSELQ